MPRKQNFDATRLLMPPPDAMHEGNSLFGPPPDQRLIESVEEMEAHLLALQPEPEAMPAYIQDLMAMAGVPRSLTTGQTLEWTNACKTSVRYLHATAQVSDCSQWVEFQLAFATGRNVRMRTSRNEEVLALEDSAGINGSEAVFNTVAGITLDFAEAVRQLMITH
jgi:hypothetical protein